MHIYINFAQLQKCLLHVSFSPVKGSSSGCCCCTCCCCCCHQSKHRAPRLELRHFYNDRILLCGSANRKERLMRGEFHQNAKMSSRWWDFLSVLHKQLNNVRFVLVRKSTKIFTAACYHGECRIVRNKGERQASSKSSTMKKLSVHKWISLRAPEVNLLFFLSLSLELVQQHMCARCYCSLDLLFISSLDLLRATESIN
jgi:hypothetical protein